MTYTAGNWQNLIQEMRALAANNTNSNMKRTLLDIANRYYCLAQPADKVVDVEPKERSWTKERRRPIE